MAFNNESVLPLAQETSEFLKSVREILRTGHSKDDSWSVDRENNRVLIRQGNGHEIDDYDQEYWEFLVGEDRYSFTTKQIEIRMISAGPSKKLALTRDILYFRGGDLYQSVPDDDTIQILKEAFQAHGAYCMASKDEECEHTLLWKQGPV